MLIKLIPLQFRLLDAPCVCPITGANVEEKMSCFNDTVQVLLCNVMLIFADPYNSHPILR